VSASLQPLLTVGNDIGTVSFRLPETSQARARWLLVFPTVTVNRMIDYTYDLLREASP
jgi:hypothetical protein